MKKFREFTKKYVSFNVLEWRLFESKSQLYSYKKGEIIHYSGDVFNRLMFINKGIVRAYIIDKKGRDITWNIFFNDKNSKMENLYVVDYESFVNRTESKMSFEVLDDCELLSINYNELQKLYDFSKKSEKFGRLMAEIAYSYIHNKVVERLTKDAKERFELFMKQTPYLLEKVPQYHIATFLGITPQSLSRLKKDRKINICE